MEHVNVKRRWKAHANLHPDTIWAACATQMWFQAYDHANTLHVREYFSPSRLLGACMQTSSRRERAAVTAKIWTKQHQAGLETGSHQIHPQVPTDIVFGEA